MAVPASAARKLEELGEAMDRMQHGEREEAKRERQYRRRLRLFRAPKVPLTDSAIADTMLATCRDVSAVVVSFNDIRPTFFLRRTPRGACAGEAGCPAPRQNALSGYVGPVECEEVRALREVGTAPMGNVMLEKTLLCHEDGSLPPDIWERLQRLSIERRGKPFASTYRLTRDNVDELLPHDCIRHLRACTKRGARKLFWRPVVLRGLPETLVERHPTLGIDVRRDTYFALAQLRVESPQFVEATEVNAVEFSPDELIATAEGQLREWALRFGWYQLTPDVVRTLDGPPFLRERLRDLPGAYASAEEFRGHLSRLLPGEQFAGKRDDIARRAFHDPRQDDPRTLPLRDHTVLMNAAAALRHLGSWRHWAARVRNEIVRRFRQ